VFLDRVPSHSSQEWWAVEHRVAELQNLVPHQDLAAPSADHCKVCMKPVEAACYRNDELFHLYCLRCEGCKKLDAYTHDLYREFKGVEVDNCKFCGRARDQSMIFVSTRRQFNYLLWVALARSVATFKLEWSQIFEAGQ
jgi:hypothetical protein